MTSRTRPLVSSGSAIEHTEPIAEDDAFLQAVLEEAELPGLLPALAHATGDLRLVRHAARPAVGSIGAVVPAQGGMTAEHQEQARELALGALRRLRDVGPTPLTVDDDSLQELMHYITGQVSESYLPLMEHELGFPRDAGAPQWTIQEVAPGREFRVVVVGAGMSGLVAAHRLRAAGLDVTVLEKAGDIGGTWLQNTYPGCRLDTNNFGYSYSFAQNADWPHQYSTRDSIFEYFSRVADELDVRSLIRFDTVVSALEFDEEQSRWTVTYAGPDGTVGQMEADAVVSAVGQLNRPNVPDIPGRESFAGSAWHTAEWDHSVDLTGLKVIVVGTGASAFQVIPAIADEVGEMTVLQRTPPWTLPAPDYREEVRPGMTWLLQHVPFFHRWHRFAQFWTTVEGRRAYVQVDAGWEHPVSVSSRNEELRRVLEGYITSQFEDRPDLLDHVLPAYPPGAKRMVRDDGTWARTLKLPHVHLVTDGIDRIEPGGVRTADGTLHEADVIIWGTGFRASEFLRPMTVRGRDGVDLHDRWGADVRAHLGVTMPWFPNLFCLYGPNTNLVVNGSIVLFSEMAAEHAVECIRLLVSTRSRTIEIAEPVFEAYNRRIDQANNAMAWGASGVDSWYKSATGRVSQNWPLTILDYWQGTKDVDPGQFVFDVDVTAEVSA